MSEKTVISVSVPDRDVESNPKEEFTVKTPLLKRLSIWWWALIGASVVAIIVIVTTATVFTVRQKKTTSIVADTTNSLPVQTPQAGYKPIVDVNFQDPGLLQVGTTWYAYAGINGNTEPINVLMATSTDFVNWEVHHGYDVFPKVGAWANATAHVWAPDVNQLVSRFHSATIYKANCSSG